LIFSSRCDNCQGQPGVDVAGQVAGEVGTKIASQVAKLALGSAGGLIISGLTTVLGFIGDQVQRDKCKLGCCPPNNLAGSWACKYQNKQTCNGSYSEYPGHGDHACWWNDALNRCETGIACRDKTFNFFSLFGSVCPKCQQCPKADPQWSQSALQQAGLPSRFYVDPDDEFLWCSPKGSPGSCSSNKAQLICELSYADENGDKNCVWDVNRKLCVKGRKCDNGRERTDAAKKLGLIYINGAWRRNGVEIWPANLNNNANRGGATLQTQQNLLNALNSGFSANFKVCVANCNNASNCVMGCILNYR